MANEIKPQALAPATVEAPKQTQTVWVQSILRPNYGGSFRIGRFWPSSQATKAEVTRDELRLLVEDPLLHVFDREPKKLDPSELFPNEVTSVEAAPAVDTVALSPDVDRSKKK